MSQRNRLRYSKLQANIVEIESKKILEACKDNGILSKNLQVKTFHMTNILNFVHMKIGLFNIMLCL